VADLLVPDLEDMRMLEEEPELQFEMGDRSVVTVSGGEVRLQRVEPWTVLKQRRDHHRMVCSDPNPGSPGHP
jgi:pyruvate-formate lyase-activating enzyme